jgi:hypothetical protein
MFTGITIKQTPTILEEEITRLKVPNNKIFTSTGDKIVDANARKIMAPLLVQTFDVVRDTDFYRQAGQDTQKIVMQNLLGWVQKNAKDIAVKTSEAEAFAEGKQARLFEVKYIALAPEVKRATAEFYKQNMKQDLAETKDYVSALAIAAALKKQPGFATGGLASKVAGEVVGTTLKKSASELLQEAKALAAKKTTTEVVAPAVQQTNTLLTPAKKAAPQPVVEAAPTPVAPAVAEPAPSFLEATKNYSFEQMNQAESLLKTKMGSQYQLDKYKADFPQDYQNSLLATMKEISTETFPTPPTTKLSKEELQKADDALLAEDIAKKNQDISTTENLNKPNFIVDTDRKKQVLSKIKDIRTTAFNALKQLPEMGSISDDALAVAQGDYRIMKKREVDLTNPADINEFTSFATNYQKRLDDLREQYKDRPPVRLYHGSMTERTPAKLKRGFFDPQGIDSKKHMELDVGATSFTKDLRLNYSDEGFGGEEAKNISFVDIPYADYLFRRVNMPLTSYQKKDMNVIAQTITGSPDIARPLGLPRSLGFRETEDAFVESEKLSIKADPATVQKTFDLFKKQKDVSATLQNRLETIANKYDSILGVGKEQAMLANEAYKNIKLLFLNEFRHTGGKKALQEGMLPSFESNQTTIGRLRLLNKELQFDMQDLLAKTAKSLQQAGATDKAEALLELKKNLREIAKPGLSSDKDYEITSVKKMTEAADAIRRLVGGEERVIQKLEGAEGPASQYPKNVKRSGLAKGGLASRRV